MTPQDRLIRAIKGTKRTIAETDEALTHFNDPEWPDQIRPILRVADEIRKLHEVQPDIGVADDYTNLAAVLSQIVWPEELEADDPDLSDEDYRNQDRRLTILRNWMGGLQADIGRILAAANAMGIRAFDPGLIQLVAKAGHRDDLKTIETGLTKLGQNLALLNVEDGSNDVRTRTITRYFQTWVQINIDISQLALAVGPLIDLALFKRVGSVIAERTSNSAGPSLPLPHAPVTGSRTAQKHSASSRSSGLVRLVRWCEMSGWKSKPHPRSPICPKTMWRKRKN